MKNGCHPAPPVGLRRTWLGVALLALLWLGAPVFGADSPIADTNNVHLWLTNTLRPWLTRSYPEISSKFYPEWFHDHPPGLLPTPFTNWLDKVFPDLETE